MKIKNFFQRMLTAAAVVVLGLGMVSCVDNIDNSTKQSEKEQQAQDAKQEKAQKYWAVVSQLVDVDDYTEDYEGKTFEPTYGIAQGDDGTRYVFTNTAAAAAARFADLVERDDIDENTETYTYDDPDVGTLTYTKGSGRILATVGVRVKQIPNLKKIVYVPGAYSNGNFRGKAYYRFGDVVARKVGNDMEYWICVRPSFGMEGKGDSHWVCLNSLPEKNIRHYHSDTNNKDYYLPKGLGTDKENMQNLAEMLYAIYFPEQWEANVKDIAYTDLKMFHDFNKTNYKFHNKYFWENVRNAWKKAGVLENALDYPLGEEAFKDMLQDQGLHLLYYGNSWSTWRSWYCTLYDAWYKCGDANKEKNMHQASYKEVEKHMKDLNVDCRKMGQRYIVNYNQFFADNQPRLAVRHATGKELSSDGQYDVKGAIHGVTTLYRYYQDVNPTDDYTQDPEETPGDVAADNVEVGYIIGKNGKFYRSTIDAQEEGEGAVAMVVYLGGDKCVEKSKDWNGLAVALKDVEDMNGNKKFKYCGEDNMFTMCTNNASIKAHLAGRCDGWAMTQRLKNHACNAEHSHPGAEAVGAMAKMEGFSEWFIPSAGQWDLAMEGMGFGKYTERNTMIYGMKIWEYPLQGNTGAVALEDDEKYMSSTERTRNQYHANGFNDVDGNINCLHYSNEHAGIRLQYALKTEDYLIRPFIAFKYGQGGRVNPEEPWAPLPAPQAKSWMGEDGRFYKTTYDVWTATGYLPVAYAAYYSADKTITVNGKDYHGLGIATYTQGNEFKNLAWADLEGKLNVYKTRLTDNVRQEKGFSAWFVPSKAHWQIALEKGFDCQFDGNTVVEKEKGSKKTEMFDFYCDCDMRTSALVGPYWTATTTDNDQAYYIDLMSYHTIQFLPFDKKATQVSKASTSAFCLRPMIAF